MDKRVLTGILAVFLIFSVVVKAGAESYHEGEVEEYIVNQLAAANIPGASLSIVTSQKEVYSVAFGDVKETSSDLQICALTRTFTTLAVMQLVEKGDIQLDDKINKYIKDSPQPGATESMTIRWLLSYTGPSGNGLELADNLEVFNTDDGTDDLSVNAKYNLLGRVIESVSGESYADYIKENITGPLDMKSTYTLDEASPAADIIQGSRNYFGLPLKNDISSDGDYWLGIPSNGIVSDVKDLGKYMQMYLSAGGKIVSYKTIDSIMNESSYMGKSIFGTDAYYSMGWTVTEKDGEKIYYCNGSVDNYTSAMFIIPSKDIGVVLLFNSADVLTGQKFTDKIEAGAVSLVMGGTAKPVSSNSYLMQHGVMDIIYFFAFVFSLLPLLMMEVWVKWTKEKDSIIRMSADIMLHIVLPTALIFLVGHYIASWKVLKMAMPDLFFVAALVAGLFYIGGIAKVIAYIVIKVRGSGEGTGKDMAETDAADAGFIDMEPGKEPAIPEEGEASDKSYKYKDVKTGKMKKEQKEKAEASDRKDRLLKRMKMIKESEETEYEKKNTTVAETAEMPDSIINDKTVEEGAEGENTTGKEKTEDDKADVQKAEEDKIAEEAEKENITEEEKITEETADTVKKTDNNKSTQPDNNTGKGSVAAENTAAGHEPGRPHRTVKGKAETASRVRGRQEQPGRDYRPKRFIVVNNPDSSKQKKDNNTAEARKPVRHNNSAGRNSTAADREKNRNNNRTGNINKTVNNRRTSNNNRNNFNKPVARNSAVNMNKKNK